MPHFTDEMHFRDRICVFFIQISLKFCFIIDLDDGLVSNRRQVITWTNAIDIIWRH